MRFRRVGIILLAALAAIVAGAQFRIAKITIEEPDGPRTVVRLCLPGGKPDVFAMTDNDFMCRLYDWYGVRELDGGFGVATESIVSAASGAAPTLPDERDRLVLESLLLHLLADAEFNLTEFPRMGRRLSCIAARRQVRGF